MISRHQRTKRWEKVCLYGPSYRWMVKKNILGPVGATAISRFSHFPGALDLRMTLKFFPGHCAFIYVYSCCDFVPEPIPLSSPGISWWLFSLLTVRRFFEILKKWPKIKTMCKAINLEIMFFHDTKAMWKIWARLSQIGDIVTEHLSRNLYSTTCLLYTSPSPRD